MITNRNDSARSNAQRGNTRVTTRSSAGTSTSSRHRHLASSRTALTPARRTTDVATTARSDGSGGLKAVQPRGPGAAFARRGLGLRGKFMLVLTGVTAVALIGLGFSTSLTTNDFLFGQKQEAGVEIGKLVAQIGTAVHDRLRAMQALRSRRDLAGLDLPAPTQNEVQKEISNLLLAAKDWGGGSLENSDILAVAFDCPDVPEIGQAGIGKLGDLAILKQWNSIYVPKIGAMVPLHDPDIVLSEGIQDNHDGTKERIYRFKIALDPSFGHVAGGGPANVRVDIAAESVTQVRDHLFMTIGIAVFIAIGVVIAVANWLAGNITRPLDFLMRDMKTVARGQLDHETRVRSTDEIGTLANEFNRMTVHLKVAQSALIEQEKAAYELSIAREVQRHLLPAEAPTIMGFDCAAFYQGAKAVSGDYFDFIPLGNGLWGFIIADVSGKGIPGSMVMAVMRTIVRLIANRYQHRAADTLKETNRLISQQIKRGMFVTAFYAILEESSGELTYASAGHNPMVIYRAATRSYELGTGKGIALGFDAGPVFDRTIQETRTVLGAGDTMVIYTDGFPEAMNAQNVEFGEERFYQAIAASGEADARTLISRVVEDIKGHRGEAEQSDDLTIIAVRNVAGT